jgi:hypothetical protein
MQRVSEKHQILKVFHKCSIKNLWISAELAICNCMVHAFSVASKMREPTVQIWWVYPFYPIGPLDLTLSPFPCPPACLDVLDTPKPHVKQSKPLAKIVFKRARWNSFLSILSQVDAAPPLNSGHNPLESSSNSTRLMVGNWLLCIQDPPCLVILWCVLEGIVEVWTNNILYPFIEGQTYLGMLRGANMISALNEPK